MKFTHSFAAFLKNTVNLNQTRVDQADAAFDTLTSFVKNATETKDLFKQSSRQGSLRQGTIIKPRTDQTEFDVDVLVDVKDVSDWKAADYLDAFHKAFKNSERYKELVDRRGKNRCVTIDYATNDFHVDIVPSVERSGQCYIMNRRTNAFELTDGDGYAAWFTGRNEITGGAELVRVVRLCKYLRDEHDWPVKSILLTTLLGLRVYDTDRATTFPDTPTALITLLSRTDTWLQSQKTMPQVANPALPTETFTRHWDQETFEAFQKKFHESTVDALAAYNEADADKSGEAWRKVFGDKFPIVEEDLESGGELAKAAALTLGPSTHARPLSDIAPEGSRREGYLNLRAWTYSYNGKVQFDGISSPARVSAGRAIKFRAATNVSRPYWLHWQVVNTGGHAAAENALRGNFFKGKKLDGTETGDHDNWEQTKYTGSHWIQCFAVRGGVCVAQSERFIINIWNPAFPA
jgi:hypothetical protein